MKKYLLVVVLCFVVNLTYAQLIKDNSSAPKKQVDLDWFNCSFEKDGVYGAEVNRAYEFLKGKKMKKRPVVALIGSGIDVEHEDLKANIWVNKKEKNNGKDNDKNGLVGDINGWNFLGGKDGSVMEFTMREGDREFLRLKEKYADYIFDGKNYFKIVDGKKTEVAPPTDMDGYNYYRTKVIPESSIASTYGGYQFSYVLLDYAHKFNEILKKKYQNKKITAEEVAKTCYDPKAPRDSLGEIALWFLGMSFNISRVDNWEDVYNSVKDGQHVALAKKDYEQNLERFGSDGRKEMIGDNYLDMDSKSYGNNVLLTSDAAIGTMQAGVIAAQRENGLGMDGIADAEIMTLRVKGVKGEPYLKDMALAIRYAVDHKVDVIVLPEQNTLYPQGQREWMIEALRYAESKGVLVIVPAWELSLDLSKTIFYPNRWMDGEKEFTNLMVVSSSDKKGNPSLNSNYGAKEVDLYAPGIELYSTYTGDTYQAGNGVALAAASTAGVAVLIKAYYPHLSGSQIRNLLIENVTSRADVEVEKGIIVDGQQAQDLFLFGDLCLSGGILNAYQAVVAASKMGK